ncbi:MAG: insulinase family protein [Bullifex sp.]
MSTERVKNIDVHHYIHSSGFRVCYADADDSESFFAYSFQTFPYDSSGVFHILEHTILSGSERYRVRDPFNTISKSSCNTYLNALTFPDRTMYPGASPLKKDFDNIFSLYTDAVFRPLLRKETFMAEGIRQNGDSFEGVVFNEMQNETLNHESIVSSHSLRDLFRGTCYQYSSGGEARSIATLTYEEYLKAFDKYYHPSNGMCFFYGKDVDIEEKLEIIDSYIGQCEKRERPVAVLVPDRWEKPEEKTLYSSTSDGDDRITVITSFLTDGDASSAYDRMMISVLVDALLGSPACPLYGAVLSSGLAEDISSQSGMSADFSRIPFAVGMTGVKDEDTGKAGQFLLDTIRCLAEEGFEKDLIESAIRRQEFLAREIPGGIPNGFRLFLRSVRSLENDRPIAEDIDVASVIARVRSDWEKDPDLFRQWIRRNLKDNPHRLTLTVKPSADVMAEESRCLRQTADERLSLLSREDDEAFRAFISSADSKEDIAALPRLTLSDVPVVINDIANEEHGQIIIQQQLTGGIIYMDIASDVSDLADEDLRVLSLLTRLLPLTGLKGEEKTLVHRKLRMLTGSTTFSLETGRKSDGSVRCFFIVRTKVLPGNMRPALSAVASLLRNADVTDEQALSSAISDSAGDFRENIIYSGSSFAASAAAAVLSPSQSVGEDVMGIKAWQFFSSLTPDRASSLVERVYCRLSDKGRYLVHLTLEEDEGSAAIEEAERFLDTFTPSSRPEAAERSVTENSRFISYPIPAAVSYNAVAAQASPYPSREQAAEEIVTSMLSSGPLWEEVRMKSGAYGVEMYLDSLEESIITVTHSDPHVKTTFDTILETVRNAVIREEDAENAKLTVLGRLLRPMAPAVKSMVGFRRYLYGITPEMRAEMRKALLDVSAQELEEAALRIASAIENGSFVSLSASSLPEEERFECEVRTLPVN